MTLQFFTRGARNFGASLDGRYMVDIDNLPVRGALGSNGLKGAWVLAVRAGAPASVRALNGARYLRESEAEAAIKIALLG